MAKKDELKAMIDLYKAILLSFLTALFGVLGYTFINFESFAKYKIIIISCVSLLLFVCVIMFLIFILRFAKKLGKED